MVQKPEKVRSAVFAGKKDLWFIVLLLAFSFLAWGIHSSNVAEAPQAWRVKIFTDPPQEFYIDKLSSRPLPVRGKLGPALIEFKPNGEFRIASSTCPQHTCMHYGWSADASIICVPNGIVVGPAQRKDKIDAISR